MNFREYFWGKLSSLEQDVMVLGCCSWVIIASMILAMTSKFLFFIVAYAISLGFIIWVIATVLVIWNAWMNEEQGMLEDDKKQIFNDLPIEDDMAWYIEKRKGKFYVDLLLTDDYGYREEPLGVGESYDPSTAMGIAWAGWQGKK